MSKTHSQNDSGDLRGVAGGDGELGCLCGKAGTSHLCDGSAHSSGAWSMALMLWLPFELLLLMSKTKRCIYLYVMYILVERLRSRRDRELPGGRMADQSLSKGTGSA